MIGVNHEGQNHDGQNHDGQNHEWLQLTFSVCGTEEQLRVNVIRIKYRQQMPFQY